MNGSISAIFLTYDKEITNFAMQRSVLLTILWLLLHKQCHLHQQYISLCFENIFEASLRDKCLFVDGLGWIMNIRMLVG